MILCDPFAINTLSLSTVRHLQELVGQETLPRVSAAAGCTPPSGWVCGQARVGRTTALPMGSGCRGGCGGSRGVWPWHEDPAGQRVISVEGSLG